MTIPEPIQALIERLNRELEEAEQQATYGLNLLQPIMLLVANNAIMLKYFVFFNNALLLVNIFRRRLQNMLRALSANDMDDEQIQEIGEELGTLLGRTLETKIEAQNIVRILED